MINEWVLGKEQKRRYVEDTRYPLGGLKHMLWFVRKDPFTTNWYTFFLLSTLQSHFVQILLKKCNSGVIQGDIFAGGMKTVSLSTALNLAVEGTHAVAWKKRQTQIAHPIRCSHEAAAYPGYLSVCCIDSRELSLFAYCLVQSQCVKRPRHSVRGQGEV